MPKNVIFSDSTAVLKEQRNNAFRLGLSVQLRDLNSYAKDFQVDGQFADGRAIIALSKDAPAHLKERAKDVKAAYDKRGTSFYKDLAALLSSQADEKDAKLSAELVEGVDTPAGPGTVKDMKGTARKGK